MKTTYLGLASRILTIIFTLGFAQPSFAVDPALVEQQLKADGCVGWIHGEVADQNLFVFTYRNPSDFFDYAIFSLTTSDPVILKQFKTLTRHDQVKIKGSYLRNPSPQKHIEVTSLEVVGAYSSSYPSGPYQHQAKLPDELMTLTSATFLVHAIAGEGKVLVVEYKDSIIPIYAKSGIFTKDLYKNDLVKLKFKIKKPEAGREGEPMHLRLDEADPMPVEILESIRDLHGKPAVVEGALVMFPKSPEIIFNVFAVEQTLQDGLKRQYTIVNFESSDVFTEVRLALQKAWDEHPGLYVNGRNKLVSTAITVKVTGDFNLVAVNQANPQILIKSLADVIIKVK